ncbi:MAG: hypothetical protein WC250_00060 [Candidatus Paceibacterota bacterium]
MKKAEHVLQGIAEDAEMRFSEAQELVAKILLAVNPGVVLSEYQQVNLVENITTKARHLRFAERENSRERVQNELNCFVLLVATYINSCRSGS